MKEAPFLACCLLRLTPAHHVGAGLVLLRTRAQRWHASSSWREPGLCTTTAETAGPESTTTVSLLPLHSSSSAVQLSSALCHAQSVSSAAQRSEWLTIPAGPAASCPDLATSIHESPADTLSNEQCPLELHSAHDAATHSAQYCTTAYEFAVHEPTTAELAVHGSTVHGPAVNAPADAQPKFVDSTTDEPAGNKPTGYQSPTVYGPGHLYAVSSNATPHSFWFDTATACTISSTTASSTSDPTNQRGRACGKSRGTA